MGASRAAGSRLDLGAGGQLARSRHLLPEPRGLRPAPPSSGSADTSGCPARPRAGRSPGAPCAGSASAGDSPGYSPPGQFGEKDGGRVGKVQHTAAIPVSCGDFAWVTLRRGPALGTVDPLAERALERAAHRRNF